MTAASARDHAKSAPTGRVPGRHLRLLLLPLCLVALAAALRLWGVGFGLPYLYHPDEPVSVQKALAILRTGSLNPGFFDWPPLLLYLNALSYLPYYLVGKLRGDFHSLNDIADPLMNEMGSGFIEQPGIVLIGRLLSVVLGCGVVLLTYLSGRDLTGRRVVGAIAGLLVAISPTAVSNSRYATPDTLMLFFVLLTFWASVKISRHAAPVHYALAGAAAGLAAASKYNGAIALVCLLCAHEVTPGHRRLFDKRLALALAASALAFVVATPYALLDAEAFQSGIDRVRQHYSRGHLGFEGNTPAWYLSYLWGTEGPAIALAMLELLRGIRTRSRDTGLLAAFPVVYFAVISSAVVRNERTLIPVIPFVFLLAASFLVAALGWLSARGIGRLPRNAFAMVLVAALASVPVSKTVRASAKLSGVDSRETARVWIAANLPPRSMIAVEAYSPYISRDRFLVVAVSKAFQHDAEWYRANGFQYVVFSEGMFRRFYVDRHRYQDQIRRYEALFRDLERVRIFRDGGYEVRVYRVPNPRPLQRRGTGWFALPDA